jgi:predicted nucleotidyltransferase
MHEDIAAHRDELAALCRDYGVRRLAIFGSAARGDDFDEEASDADFLVEFDGDGGRSPLGQFFGFAQAIENVLGRRVDLVEWGALSNPFILASIEKAHELVYAA